MDSKKAVFEAEPEQQLLLVPEAAKLLRVKPSTIRAWILKRRIQFVKIGGRVCVRRSDLDALILAGVVPTEPNGRRKERAA